jgi:release factor glutamine methyltransferase
MRPNRPGWLVDSRFVNRPGPEPLTRAVAELLAEGARRLEVAGSGTPALDAELLLSSVAGLSHAAVRAQPDAPIGEMMIANYRAAVARRETGEPVAYIRGHKQFYGLVLRTEQGTFIPRPESERLVELAYAEVARLGRLAQQGLRSLPISVVDVGTGCGAVMLALATLLRAGDALGAMRLHASDVSYAAVAVARRNAVELGFADLITFDVCDLVPPAPHGGWDLILANLPYIRTGAVDRLPPRSSFEPRLALDGGPDGLVIVSRLLDRLPDVLAPGGAAVLEIGIDQRAALAARVAERLPGWSVELPPDYGVIVRSA